MYNEDYVNALSERFKPKPDNLKLLLVAGAALFSTIILTALLAGFYWNGDWNVKTPAGETLSHSADHSTDNHTTDPAETHDQPNAKAPEEKH